MKTIDVYYDKRFLKEKKKFHNICPSIENDFKRFEIALKVQIKDNKYTVPVDNNRIFRIAGLDKTVSLPAFVVKAFYCEKMNKGSKSGFRITFLYDPSKRIIYFVEFYFKEKKKIEDKNRINKLFKN